MIAAELIVNAFRRGRLLGVAAAGALLLAAGLVSPAAAQSSCQADMENLAKKRIEGMEEVNRLAKAGKGKLDPIAACPRLRSLAAAEAALLDYVNKNKDWCGVPDALVQNLTDGHAKTVKFAAQACDVAAKVKKMQQLQAQQQAAGAAAAAAAAPKLPTGPL